MLETIISKKFKLITKLGISPFYEVFKGVHLKNETLMAIKIEQRSVSDSKLATEARIIRDIQGEEVADLGIPRIVELGTEDNFNYLMVDLLGPSLDALMLNSGGKLQLRLALDLARQMVERVQTLHSRGYVHRDLRPDHFLYGRENRPTRLFLSGFAIAKKYLRSDGKHQGYRDSRLSFAGTARYCSINTQLGVEQSRRDDIESILYILIYLVRGYLPWQGVKAVDRKEKFEKILMVKVATPIE
jgi:serine/threonine protein kinase